VRNNSARPAPHFFCGLTWLDAVTGAVRHTIEVPQLSGLAVSRNGKVFATGGLIPGDSIAGSNVTPGSTFAAKFDEGSSVVAAVRAHLPGHPLGSASSACTPAIRS
jgi:hypothetical protein